MEFNMGVAFSTGDDDVAVRVAGLGSGLSQQAISYIERRLRQPSFETILRIADGIGVNLEEMFKQAQAAVSKKSGK